MIQTDNKLLITIGTANNTVLNYHSVLIEECKKYKIAVNHQGQPIKIKIKFKLNK